jgi:hypothetical protein
MSDRTLSCRIAFRTQAALPTHLSVPDETLNGLLQGLSLATFPDQLDGANHWDFGIPSSEVKRLVNYWKDGFNWRMAEMQLNKLPNFKTSIQGDGFGNVDIHCKYCPSHYRDSVF